jgi:hypothetical protein
LYLYFTQISFKFTSKNLSLKPKLTFSTLYVTLRSLIGLNKLIGYTHAERNRYTDRKIVKAIESFFFLKAINGLET